MAKIGYKWGDKRKRQNEVKNYLEVKAFNGK
jgi:hypothetical protein